MFESYENGETDIPMGFLLDFAKHCNIDLTDLLSGGTPMLSTYSFIKRAGDKVLKDEDIMSISILHTICE